MEKIPRFKSEQKEAEYWDLESVADHLDELEEVEVKVSRELYHTLSVRIDRENFRKLQALAAAQGVGVTIMARMLLKQALGGGMHG